MEAQFSFVRPHAQPKVAVWRPPLLIGWKLKSCGNALKMTLPSPPTRPPSRSYIKIKTTTTATAAAVGSTGKPKWPKSFKTGLLSLEINQIQCDRMDSRKKRNVCHLDACWWQRQRINELKFVDHVTHSTPMRGSCSNNNGGKAVGFDLIGPRLLTRPLASLSSFRTNETNQHDWW